MRTCVAISAQNAKFFEGFCQYIKASVALSSDVGSQVATARQRAGGVETCAELPSDAKTATLSTFCRLHKAVTLDIDLKYQSFPQPWCAQALAHADFNYVQRKFREELGCAIYEKHAKSSMDRLVRAVVSKFVSIHAVGASAITEDSPLEL